MSNTPATPPADLDTSSREARLSLVHQQLPLALTGSLVAAVLVFIALNNELNLRAPLTLWLLALGSNHGLSLLLLGRIRRLSRLQWRRRAYLLIYFSAGLIWGLLGFALLSFGLGIAQWLLIVLALVTTTGGILVSGAGLFALYPLFLLPALLPLASVALALGGRFNILLTSLLAVFSASTLLAALGLHRVLACLFQERGELTQRLAELSVSNRRLQREVDDYRSLREDLSKQETHYRTLLETMDCGVYLLEAERFSYANPAWEDFCGYSLEALQTLSPAQLIHPDDHARVLTPTGNRLAGSPETDYLACRLLHRDGSSRQIYLAARTLVFHNRLVTLGSALPLEGHLLAGTRTTEASRRPPQQGNPAEPGWLSAALANDRLQLYYRSVAALPGEQDAQHGELLARLLDDTQQPMDPAALLKPAERAYLLPWLDRWLVQQALSLLASDHPLLTEIEVFQLRLSGESLGNLDFHEFLLQNLDAALINRQRLCIGITEATVIDNPQEAIPLIQALQERGCLVALDDFANDPHHARGMTSAEPRPVRHTPGTPG